MSLSILLFILTMNLCASTLLSFVRTDECNDRQRWRMRARKEREGRKWEWSRQSSEQVEGEGHKREVMGKERQEEEESQEHPRPCRAEWSVIGSEKSRVSHQVLGLQAKIILHTSDSTTDGGINVISELQCCYLSKETTFHQLKRVLCQRWKSMVGSLALLQRKERQYFHFVFIYISGISISDGVLTSESRKLIKTLGSAL